jgi:hypothetical protein
MLNLIVILYKRLIFNINVEIFIELEINCKKVHFILDNFNF